jgi:hypothetical protein
MSHDFIKMKYLVLFCFVLLYLKCQGFSVFVLSSEITQCKLQSENSHTFF